jgi:hypothetical protein
MGGGAGLANKIKTSLQTGLVDDKEEFVKREEHLGSNYKAPLERKSFCHFFFKALEDFLLRLLLICAIISIIFNVSFA